MASDASDSEGDVPGPSRKARKSVENWKKVQRKRKRDSGEEYTSVKGVTVVANTVGPPCACL